MKVHVVEDEADLQKAAGFYLQNDSFEVTKSTTGATAVEDITTHKPDVILLDLLLPEKSGMDILRELRKQGVKTPVIIMTNLPIDNVNTTELAELGVNKVLTKVHTDFSELADEVLVAYRQQVEKADDPKE